MFYKFRIEVRSSRRSLFDVWHLWYCDWVGRLWKILGGRYKMESRYLSMLHL